MRITGFDQKIRELERRLSLKDRQDISFLSSQISQMVRLSRIHKGYTQRALAERIGKKQSSIARLESGKHAPTIAFLNEIAVALDTYLVEPHFYSIENYYYNDHTNIEPSVANAGSTYTEFKPKPEEATNPLFWEMFSLNSSNC